MKKLLLSLLFTLPALAQDGFRAEGENLVWERSFTADNANIMALIQKQPNLKVTGATDIAYTGTADNMQNTCSEGSALLKNNCKFDFEVMVTPKSYVVKITNFKIIERYGPMQARMIANRCEKYFMNISEIRNDSRTQADMNCVDSYLSSLFSSANFEQSGALTAN